METQQGKVKVNVLQALFQMGRYEEAAAWRRSILDSGVVTCFGPLPPWWHASALPRALRHAERCYRPRHAALLAALRDMAKGVAATQVASRVLTALTHIRVVERERLVRVTWRREESPASYFYKLLRLAIAFDYNVGPLIDEVSRDANVAVRLYSMAAAVQTPEMLQVLTPSGTLTKRDVRRMARATRRRVTGERGGGGNHDEDTAWQRRARDAWSRLRVTGLPHHPRVGDRVDGIANCTGLPPNADHDNQTGGRVSSSSSSKVYWIVFFGRRALVSLQLPFWRALHAQGLVDEVHLWDYTREDSDREWLYRDVATDASLAPFLRVCKKLPSHRKIIHWTAVYEYYARTLAPDDVMLKVDDDIVWVDTRRFAAFLEYRRRHADDVFVLAPNVVNNGVNAYFQHHLGGGIPKGLLVHHRLPFDKRFYGFRVSMDESMEPWLEKFHPSEAPDEELFFGYDGFERRDARGEYPAGGSHGLLWGSPGNAIALHRHFLNNTDCFLRMTGTSRIFHRLSINMIALSGRHVPWAVKLMRATKIERLEAFGDEGSLTTVAAHKHGARNEIYHGFVVTHATFGAQRSAIEDVVALYRQNASLATRGANDDESTMTTFDSLPKLDPGQDCKDDEDFVDVGGFECRAWRQFDCRHPVTYSDVRYTMKDLRSIQEHCPYSCGLCMTGEPISNLRISTGLCGRQACVFINKMDYWW